MLDEQIYENIRVKNENVTMMYFDGGVLEINEIKHLCRMFPNIEGFRIDAENILEYRTDLRSLKSLKRLAICVTASQEFTGEVDSQNDDPLYVFAIDLDDSQVSNMIEFCAVIDEFDGQELHYLLDVFGKKFNFKKIKVYVGKIMINQTYQSLDDQFYVENLYDSCEGITFHPEFKTVKCGKEVEYQL